MKDFAEFEELLNNNREKLTNIVDIAMKRVIGDKQQVSLEDCTTAAFMASRDWTLAALLLYHEWVNEPSPTETE